MNFYAKVKPVRERIMTDQARAVVDAICKSQKSGVVPNVSEIKRRARGDSEHSMRDILYALEVAGLVNVDTKMSQHFRATLTPAGWDMVGGKPIWVAE